jgi:phospholipase/carboxylesterase
MSNPSQPSVRPADTVHHGRLTSTRPDQAADSGPAGRARVDTGTGGRPALRYVPAARDDVAYRMVVLLHGAGGSAESGLELLQPLADEAQLLLLAPASTGRTWDVIVGGFGADVAMIDGLVQRTLLEYPVEAITVGGFSDGASYALSMGITNGDLFDSVVAFSPGFAAPIVAHGRPRFYVSHGTHDGVLPIDRCSRRLVPELRSAGYPVTYEEFDGPHEVPIAIRQRAVQWLDSDDEVSDV